MGSDAAITCSRQVLFVSSAVTWFIHEGSEVVLSVCLTGALHPPPPALLHEGSLERFNLSFQVAKAKHDITT